MMLLTSELSAALRANHAARRLGSISQAESSFFRAAANDLPTPGEGRDG